MVSSRGSSPIANAGRRLWGDAGAVPQARISESSKTEPNTGLASTSLRPSFSARCMSSVSVYTAISNMAGGVGNARMACTVCKPSMPGMM